MTRCSMAVARSVSVVMGSTSLGANRDSASAHWSVAGRRSLDGTLDTLGIQIPAETDDAY
jgi:hypothetical protein